MNNSCLSLAFPCRAPASIAPDRDRRPARAQGSIMNHNRGQTRRAAEEHQSTKSTKRRRRVYCRSAPTVPGLKCLPQGGGGDGGRHHCACVCLNPVCARSTARPHAPQCASRTACPTHACAHVHGAVRQLRSGVDSGAVVRNESVTEVTSAGQTGARAVPPPLRRRARRLKHHVNSCGRRSRHQRVGCMSMRLKQKPPGRTSTARLPPRARDARPQDSCSPVPRHSLQEATFVIPHAALFQAFTRLRSLLASSPRHSSS